MDRKTRLMVANELVAVAKLLAEDEDAPAITAGFIEEVKAIKMRMSTKEFLKSVIKFKGEVNKFVDFMLEQVNNRESLKEFPEFKSVLEFSNAIRTSLLPIARMPESELADRMNRVICRDAGTCLISRSHGR